MELFDNATTHNQRALLITLGLTLAFFAVEIAAGLFTHSLALLADAVHMATDAGALALAAFAAWMAQKPATPQKSYGYYRTEILAALVNGALLFFSSLYILYEAYRRFQNPGHVIGVPMLIVAVVGLVVNLVAARILHAGSQENLNMQGAFYEVVKDALGSVAVIVAGIVILTTGWTYADPLASALIALFILPRTWTLSSQAVDVLMESTPARIDTREVTDRLRETEGVADVHDLHVWTITSGLTAMSAHAVMAGGAGRREAQRALEEMRRRMQEQFDIDHTTIQIEYQDLQEQESDL